MVDFTPDSMPSVLEGLWQAAHDAETHQARSAFTDWRSSSALNIVRAYGLAVRVCSAIALSDTDDCRRSPGTVSPCDELTAEFIRLLGSFAGVAKSSPHLTADARRVTKVLNSAKDLTRRLSTSVSSYDEGAFWVPEWEQPVPPRFRDLLAGMAAPTTPSDRAAALSKVLNGPDSTAAMVLDESNVGLASAVHLALTFDSFVAPKEPVDDDQAYLQAAFVRVLISHRVLLEAIGTGDRLAFLSILGLAELIASTTKIAEDYTKGNDTAAAAQYTRRTALAVLKTSGRIRARSRKPEWWHKVPYQETLVVDALDAVIQPST